MAALAHDSAPGRHRGGSRGHRSIWKLQEDLKLGLPVKPTLAEAAALLMIRDLLRAAAVAAIEGAVPSAFDKAGRVLSREARQLLEQLREGIGVHGGHDAPGPGGRALVLIQRALLRRRMALGTESARVRGVGTAAC